MVYKKLNFENLNAKIYNGDCIKVMQDMSKNKEKANVILTSPPYNTSKKRGTWSKEQKVHYDLKEVDSMSDDEYVSFTIDLFNNYDEVLKENGVILYNISYSTDKPFLIYTTIAEIINKTNFMVADTILWKKKSALPNNMSVNRLTRICEFVFVLCRKDESKTFQMNKEVLSVRDNGIKQYTTYYNFIEAKNNDGSCKLNKATFSSDLVVQLLEMYAKQGDTVYDSFMGTGTTAVGCFKYGCNVIGSELSEGQFEYSINRLKENFEITA